MNLVISSAVHTSFVTYENIIMFNTDKKMTSLNASWLYVDSIGWSGEPHLHSWSNCQPDSWMNVLWCNVWFNLWMNLTCLIHPTGWTNRSADHSRDTTVGPTGRSNRSVQQFDRVNAAVAISVCLYHFTACPPFIFAFFCNHAHVRNTVMEKKCINKINSPCCCSCDPALELTIPCSPISRFKGHGHGPERNHRRRSVRK